MARDLARDTANAFAFIERLYLETSFLIREVEGLLQQEDEHFEILKPQGYMITSRASKALAVDPPWLPHDATVYFRPGSGDNQAQPRTNTPFTDDLRIITLRIEFIPKEAQTPQVLMCCLDYIRPKKGIRKKFEDIAFVFAYSGSKVLGRRSEGIVDYEDSDCILKGRLLEEDLFAIQSSHDIVTRLVTPVLKMYRSPALKAQSRIAVT